MTDLHILRIVQALLQEKDTSVRELIQVPPPANQDDQITVSQENDLLKVRLRRNHPETGAMFVSENAKAPMAIGIIRINSE